jgi:hypothetical protein
MQGIAFLFFIVMTFVAGAGTLAPVTFQDHVNKSDYIVDGTVDEIESRFETNRYGDRLIVSSIKINVKENLRGQSISTLTFKADGGSVGEVRLEVSDIPQIKKGDRGIFFLQQSEDGSLTPHNRGLGMQKIEWNGQIKDSRLSAEDLKSRIKAVSKEKIQ